MQTKIALELTPNRLEKSQPAQVAPIKPNALRVRSRRTLL